MPHAGNVKDSIQSVASRYGQSCDVTAMCEGKFLVKTNVTDNVIRQVTVENFRFGIRVIKKPEGRWICQDLNNKLPCKPLLREILENDDGIRPNYKESTIGSNPHTEEQSKKVSLSHNNSTCHLSNVFRKPSVTAQAAFTTTTTCSHQGTEHSKADYPQTAEKSKTKATFSSHIPHQQEKHQTGTNHRNSFTTRRAPSKQLLPDFSCDFIGRGQRSIDCDPRRVRTSHSILYQQLRCSSTPFPAVQRKPAALTRQVKEEEDTKCVVTPAASEDGLKNQYLSKILGSSPLLKLQLLNLTTVPLNDHQIHKVPDLLPVETITRLRMLFDEEGSEKTEVVAGDKSSASASTITISVPEKEAKRMRDTATDEVQLDISKRVKVETEEDGNLVIDENLGFGEELSENSEESNDDVGRGGGGEGDEQSNNSVPGDATEKRSNSASSTDSRKSIKKNGLDSTVKRVPKLPSNQSSTKVNNDDDCNNSNSSSSNNNNNNSGNNATNSVDSVTKVMRLEKEIAGLTSLLKVKEAEWNAIVRLKKLKELAVECLRRQKEVEQILEDDSIVHHEEYLKQLMERIGEEGGKIGPDEADVRLNLDKTEEEIKEAEKKLTNSRVNNAVSKSKNRDSKQNDNNMDIFKASLALKQLSERNRSSSAHSPPVSSNNSNIQAKVIAEGRQGPLVEVTSLIANHRIMNPDETGQPNEPRRRNVQKKGSGSQPKTSATSIISQNQNVSFKDVLVNLAKLSQSEKAGSSTLENIISAPRGSSKNNNNSSGQTNSFGSQRGAVGNTLAKLLSNNTSSNISVGVVHPDEDNSGSSLRIESVNNVNDTNINLANLLASSKCRDDDIKAEDDEGMVPVCQGCNTQRAQFVCAGCGNQWYCCRECQIQAWEDHSEICSG